MSDRTIHLHRVLRSKPEKVYDDPKLAGLIEVTVALTPVSCGTEPNVTQAGIPEPIPLEMCHLGWQECLLQLAALVEPDIPG